MSDLSPMFSWALVSIAILVRWLVAQFPHSGQEIPPLYGDYEAQRHWMEVTTNLPIKDWYRNTSNNDLMYWGLDYPPLTAYHMYALGKVSSKLNVSWTELNKSRGLETHDHKLFMRATVIVADLIIYVPAVIYYFYRTPPISYYSPPSTVLKNSVAIYTFLTLMYPGQILIDHGHFQYNCVFMGLVLWAIVFMTKGRQAIASILFTLALCYKQMSLYYSLAFFWLIASTNLRVKPIWKGLVNIICIGLIVIATLAFAFSPYLYDIDNFLQVMRRIFPFNRGLFEDKVANIWFSLSIFYKYRNQYSQDDLLKASTALTLLLSLPAGIHLLFEPTIRSYKYALINTSLVFFLLSFQVHEKTILVPALPILLLYREHPLVVNWFSIVSIFSLQPLLVKDGQTIPYFVLMLCYTLISFEVFRSHNSLSVKKLISVHNLIIALYYSSIAGCFLLSVSALVIAPPTRYPHIHPTINALFSCGHFVMFLLFFYYKQFRSDYKTIITDRKILLKKAK